MCVVWNSEDGKNKQAKSGTQKHSLSSSSPSSLPPKTDSWFQGQTMKLPRGCGYEFQMQYGSIGWSVGAVLGYSLAAQPEGRRVVALIGDGSFQMTAQEVSTMIRYGADPIIVLINNGGYTIEVEIHDGMYVPEGGREGGREGGEERSFSFSFSFFYAKLHTHSSLPSFLPPFLYINKNTAIM